MVETAAGPVQVLGVDCVWRRRREHLGAVCARHPRVPRGSGRYGFPLHLGVPTEQSLLRLHLASTG